MITEEVENGVLPIEIIFAWMYSKREQDCIWGVGGVKNKFSQQILKCEGSKKWWRKLNLNILLWVYDLSISISIHLICIYSSAFEVRFFWDIFTNKTTVALLLHFSGILGHILRSCIIITDYILSDTPFISLISDDPLSSFRFLILIHILPNWRIFAYQPRSSTIFFGFDWRSKR